MTCSETVPPRLSFSHDDPADVPRKDTLLLEESNHDFEFFSTGRSSLHEFEPSSADELFSNGIILPTTQMKQRTKETPHAKLLPPRPTEKSNNNREKMLDVNAANTNHEKKSQSKSFWGFGKSRSLHCDSSGKSFLSSLPPLPRSNSAGSAAQPNRKRTSSYKQQSAAAKASSSSSSQASVMKLYPSGKKSYANSLRISPVLNVPTPCCISIPKGGAGLFGFGSFLRKKTKN